MPKQKKQSGASSQQAGSAWSTPAVAAAALGSNTFIAAKSMEVNSMDKVPELLDVAEDCGADYEQLTQLEAMISHNIHRGVGVYFSPEYGTQCYGMYDPGDNLITIFPEALDEGLEMTIATIAHETVHSHQDAAAGIHNSDMTLINNGINVEGILNVINLYEGESMEVMLLEAEAWSAEEDIAQTLNNLDV